MMAKTRNVTTFPVHRFSLRVEFLTLLLSFYCPRALTQGSKITCDIPAAELLQDAVLTCSFPEDLSITRKSFSVYHYDKQEDSDAVLDCWWMDQKQECIVKANIEYNRTVNRHLSITFRQVTFANSGVYACQVNGYDPSRYQTCDLQIKTEKPASCILEPDTLTCNFNVDVNKTKANFKVVHVSDQSKSGVDVLNCRWKDDDALACEVTSGVEYSLPVTDRLTVTIPRANHSNDGEYMCQLHNSANNATRCQLPLDSGSNSDVTVIVGVLVAIFILVLIVVGILLYCKCPVKRIRKKEKTTREEDQPMLPIQVTDETTERLQESLSASIKTMYPDILTACYFVPSLYINRNTYTKVEVAGEKVVVMKPAPDDTLRHDQAIQHVLKCLRHLADRDKEAMFVLSQFTYDDYLASVDQQFSHHKLPMPSDLTRRDKRYENFDVLIVHRHYGVVVVVVKASACTADMGVELRDNERVVQDLQEAVKQLDGAERMLKHLIQDLKPGTLIRKTMMLPNLSLTSLREILEKQQNALRWSTRLTEMPDVSGECLCADQLHSDNMMNQLNVWMQKHSSGSQTDPNISDNNYLKIISRFCGPATRPSLTLPDGRRVMCTPSSLQQAVSLTGELFNGSIIHPEHHHLLTEAPPRVFLFGPPGSGKTTSLVLMGKKWLSDGHRVCVLSTWRENVTTSRFLYGMLLKYVSEIRGRLEQPKDVVFTEQINHESSTNEKQSTASQENKSHLKKYAQSKNDMQLIYKEFNLERTEVKVVIKSLLQLSSTVELFILVDDAGPNNQKESFQLFCDKLWTENKNLHLWAASSLTQMTLNKWKVVESQRTVSCPPSLLREKELIKIVDKIKFNYFINWDLSTIDVAPTEGLPVRFVYHSGEGHTKGQPLSCAKCSSCVVDLLTALHINEHRRNTSKNHVTGYSSIEKSEKSGGINPDSLTSCLYPSDVLVLFEYELCEQTTFCKTLKQSGFSIKVVEEKNIHLLSEDNGQHLWVADGRQFRGFKRKVVVYVEGHVGQSNVPLEWIRHRGVTSCTAQLIWVRDQMPEKSYT